MNDLDVEASKNFCDSLGESVTKRVTETLTANNYPTNFIYSGRQLNRQQEVNDTDQRGMVILLILPAVSIVQSLQAQFW